MQKKTDVLALITGESIGQVASQTMQSLAATNDVCTLPVLSSADWHLTSSDIVEISEKIDTYETSILPFEDCCTIFVAKHPVTKPNLKWIIDPKKSRGLTIWLRRTSMTIMVTGSNSDTSRS